MFRILCPACKSQHVMKNGIRKGIQLYKCRDCKYQFRNVKSIAEPELWNLYMNNKQTIKELSEYYNVSESTVNRILKRINQEWNQPQLSGSGFVHLDATYWGQNTAILLALDHESGKPIYLSFIHHEKVSDYVDAVKSIESRGYSIKGIIIDGIRTLFDVLSDYKLQMCQFHMKEIVKRYLTLKPKLLASRELKELFKNITRMNEAEFIASYNSWKDKWKDTLNKKTTNKFTGKSFFTHKRLRTVVNSIDYYLPYLFTFEKPECKGMPNTNNKIEGTFTDLKKNLNNHSGMRKESRKRFISGFFLALMNTPSSEKK